MKLCSALLFLFAIIAAFACATADVAEGTAVTTDAEQAATEDSAAAVAEKKKKPKKILVGTDKWKGVKFDDVEKDWEQGDEEAELESEHDRLERIRALKRPAFDINDKESLKRAYQKDPSVFGTGEGQAGTALLYVDLTEGKNGKPRSVADVRKVASRWTDMLRSGGLLVQLYHPGDNRITFHVERGWWTREVMKFAAMQKEVESITLNQKKYTPKECLKWLRDTEDDDDEL